MAALDLRFLVRELRGALQGGKVRKIYQVDKKAFLLEFFVPGHGGRLLFLDQHRVFLTERKPATPETPPMFCMFLRKHLMGKTLVDVIQGGFDRVLELRFLDATLVAEFVPPGNVILCDAARNIIMPLEIQRWASRHVAPRVPYQSPPQQRDPWCGLDDLLHALGKSDKVLAAFLATSLGLGAAYANEACSRAGLEPKQPARELNVEAVSRLHRALESLGKESVPTLYADLVSPFPLAGRTGGTPFPSFSEAIDEFAARHEPVAEAVQAAAEDDRAARIAASQERARHVLAAKRDQLKTAADLLYAHYQEVKDALEAVRQFRSAGRPWEEIKKRLPAQVVGIREHEGKLLLRLDGQEVELDLRLSVEENAARLFEQAKAAKRKLAGVVQAQAAPAKQPKQLRTKAAPAKRKRAKWYEAFRWFTTSDGFLVVAGKEAKQNDLLFSKHLKQGDLAFHADIPGAALVVIQASGRPITPEAKREAAEFAAAHSKAWPTGLGTVDVFAARPDQVSKTPPSGTGLAKGSFIISGEREWFRNTVVRLAIGVAIGQGQIAVVSGPLLAIRKRAAYFVTVRPGTVPAADLARAIRTKLLVKCAVEHRWLLEGLPPEEIQRLIPAGIGEIVDRP